jgi:ABC-type lipoprotein export system ATPase subunit
MIQMVDISKSYSFGRGTEVPVLRGLELRLEATGVTAIRGASGSGKTTLLHLLGGLDRPTGGEVRFEGASTARWTPGQLSRWRNRHVGFVFQSYQLLPELSLLENVALPGWLDRRDVRETAVSLIERVGLADRAHHRPGELSGGEQQRAALARALVNDPALILADEPTGNLDAANREAVLHLLLDLSRQKKKALVLVTHDDTVAAHADRVFDLSDGRLHERPK